MYRSETPAPGTRRKDGAQQATLELCPKTASCTRAAHETVGPSRRIGGAEGWRRRIRCTNRSQTIASNLTTASVTPERRSTSPVARHRNLRSPGDAAVRRRLTCCSLGAHPGPRSLAEVQLAKLQPPTCPICQDRAACRGIRGTGTSRRTKDRVIRASEGNERVEPAKHAMRAKFAATPPVWVCLAPTASPSPSNARSRLPNERRQQARKTQRAVSVLWNMTRTSRPRQGAGTASRRGQLPVPVNFPPVIMNLG